MTAGYRIQPCCARCGGRGDVIDEPTLAAAAAWALTAIADHEHEKHPEVAR